MIRQLCVYVEDGRGVLKKMLEGLAAEGINISSLSTYNAPEEIAANFNAALGNGIREIRISSDDDDAAFRVLRSSGYRCVLNEVVGVKVEDKPGAMAEICGIIGTMDVNINTINVIASDEAGKAIIVADCDDMDRVANKLRALEYTVV